MTNLIHAKAISNAVAKAISEFIGANPVPPTPEDGKCSFCGATDLVLNEFGYERWSRAYLDEDGDWMAQTNGWDDISQNGDIEVLACTQCDAIFQSPTEVNWS